MAEDSFQEKTEKATPKKRADAKKKGNVPKSMEVNSAVLLLFGTLTFFVFSTHFIQRMNALWIAIFSRTSEIELTSSTLPHYGLIAAKCIAVMLAPIILPLVVAAFVSNMIQGGIAVSGESIKPKLDKLNPINGVKRIFSARSLVELLKGIIKIFIIGYIGYITIVGQFKEFFPLADQDITQIIAFIGIMIFKIAIRSALVLLILSAFDFAYQKYEFERQLRMTKQEIKEEHKQIEGDPLVKSRIRALQRQMARKRMMADVATADVVITNPIHVAVALKYNSSEMSAPVLVAKGLRKIAEKIKEIARMHNIPIIENPVVARMLYKTADIGAEIPIEMYQTVAEILAHVYRQKGKTEL